MDILLRLTPRPAAARGGTAAATANNEEGMKAGREPKQNDKQTCKLTETQGPCIDLTRVEEDFERFGTR